MFQTMDADGSGAITYDELKEGLKRYGSTLKDTEIRDLMEAVSLLKSTAGLDFVILTGLVVPKVTLSLNHSEENTCWFRSY